jgi:hypothetical protein
MLKNLLLLGVLTWVSLSYARKDDFVVRDSISEAQSYRVEKAVEEQEAKRSVAGSKIKKKSKAEHRQEVKDPTESDSEVRYWQYSE